MVTYSCLRLFYFSWFSKALSVAIQNRLSNRGIIPKPFANLHIRYGEKVLEMVIDVMFSYNVVYLYIYIYIYMFDYFSRICCTL